LEGRGDFGGEGRIGCGEFVDEFADVLGGGGEFVGEFGVGELVGGAGGGGGEEWD
jgi:hypothetical protein